MVENKVYQNEFDFIISDLDDRVEPRKVLLCSPEAFDIVDVKNIHMKNKVGKADANLAVQQWNSLKATYGRLQKKGVLDEVLVIQGETGFEDMVFAANQSFPWKMDNEKVVVMSKMRYPSRQREVRFFQTYYEQLGYNPIQLQHTKLFEGMGDTIPHYGKNLLYGGFGYRSELAAYEELTNLLQVPVVTLHLTDPRFYHLDTCFLPVDTETVFLAPVAFDESALVKIKKLFKNIIEIPEEEAETFFALNAHCINDQKSGIKTAIVQRGTSIMKSKLEGNGFDVIELNTSEFIKSGGSVFCMKMMLY